MGRIVTIALGAFKESVRERVLYNLIVFAFLMIGAAILMGSISVGVERLILVNLGSHPIKWDAICYDGRVGRLIGAKR